LAHVERVLTSPEKSALEACVRLLDEERRGVRFSVSIRDVDHAAGALFAFVQQALHWLQAHGYGARDEQFLIELWRLQALAFDAAGARCPGGRRRAKELQLEAGHGEPLTACVGALTPERLPDLRDVLDPNGELEEYVIPTIIWNTRGSGCMAICPDSTGTRRPGLRRWCQTCCNSSSARLEAQIMSIKKNFEGSPSSLVWVEGQRVRVWPRTCSVCGFRFKTTRANRWRCDSCLTGRRSVPRTRSSAPPSS
jgi:hypothetical protein